jgi:uncharacterized membrane protein
MNARALRWIAGAALVALIGVSAALVVMAPSGAAVQGLPPGVALAIGKVFVLAIMLRQVRNANVYAMQWSSMLILLFFAEGAVRAASDPQPTAAWGGVEAACATLFFVAVLAILRPLKQAAKHRPVDR